MKVGELVWLLEEDGWRLARTRGSHRQYRNADEPGTSDSRRETEVGRATRHVERDTEAGRPEEGRD